MTRTTQRDFDSLRIEGGLFPSQFLNALRELKLKGQGSTDYQLHRTLKLRDEISRYWRIAKAEWEGFREARLREDINRQAVAVDGFLVPLLRHVFGFHDLEASRPVYLGERRFPLTHRAGLSSGGVSRDNLLEDTDRRVAHVPLVLTGPDFALDKSHAAFGDESRRRSPQGLLQEFLNASPDALWGIVSNGLVLRVLRDNPSMTRPAYLEVDLVRMFEDDLYPDFVALWLTLHASRFLPQDGKTSLCWLEQWREQAVEEGERARGELRSGVEQALRALGTGFVAHPANQALREAISSGELTPNAYFQQLLRLVYRFIFLLTAEDRQILHDPQATPEARALYAKGYSLSQLRDRARKRRFHDQYSDLWQGLSSGFHALRNGEPLLGLPALGGLFGEDQCPWLEPAELGNKHLLTAVSAMTWVRRKTGATRINYRDMDTEELGSVYESLLELIPRINPATSPWQFGFMGDAEEESNQGNARKTSGSYYTPDSLVQELIQSALLPVIDQRLKASPEQPRQALLSIKVCDPACGSGHFLLAAARRLAARLAELDAQGDQYSEPQYRHALREVVQHCIFGVDLNPLAVELCRTALWLEALEPGKPLGFLDAHIQCGNALIGVFDPAVLEDGIPDDAFKPLTGDDKAVASEAKKRNKQYGKSIALRLRMGGSLAAGWEALPEETVSQVAAKRQAWLQAQAGEAAEQARLLEDVYTAAFFVPKVEDKADFVPTNADLVAAHEGRLSVQVREAVREAARRYRFFHWRLAFPQVFDRAQQGFDVVLGNPPWERIKLQEKEFFAARHPAVANAMNAAERERLIEGLSEGLPWERELQAEFFSERRGAEASSLFARSGRFPLTGVGDVNLYALFAEQMLVMIGQGGRAGVIVPTGIATDDGTKAYFAHVAGKQRLVSLYDFENRDGIFPSVHKSYKFSLLTLGDDVPIANLVFFAANVDQLRHAERRFGLTPEEFRLLNPNTRTCAVFRSLADAELTKKLYRRAPVLIREESEHEPEINPWNIRFQAMFHMSNDSSLFQTYDKLAGHGCLMDGNRFLQGDQRFLPLYEAKMVHHYDHRWATYERNGEDSRDMTLAEKQSPNALPLPRYWVDEWEVVLRTTEAPPELVKAYDKGQQVLAFTQLGQWAAAAAIVLRHPYAVNLRPRFTNSATGKSDLFSGHDDGLATHVQQKFPLTLEELETLLPPLQREDYDGTLAVGRGLLKARCPKYLLGWRDITNATNERTVITDVIPFCAVGNKFPLILLSRRVGVKEICALNANLSALPFDFVARQKIGGTTLNFFIIKQFPVLPPEAYSESDLAYIVSRVLELTYTAHDLKPFAEDLGYHGDPFPWNPDRRHQLKSELDAYYARLYGLDRDELRYILDPADVMGDDYPSVTFPTLKRKEIAEFGEYRTRTRVLAEFDRLAGESRDALHDAR